ncbi:M23 family metallopeptidase [Streptomyces sp. NPDC006632]|uniref:M23 family metallopeptidase n=1 Tax=Streptomyces sp. NPDC006632 TaxID=3157182 RepID=UPI0033B43861
MTDQHAHAGYVGHDGYFSGSNGPGGNGPHAPSTHSTGGFDVDPLFGAMGNPSPGPAGPAAQNGYATGRAGQFDTGAFATGAFATDAFASPYDSTGQWTVPAQATAYEPDGATGTFDTSTFDTGTFDTSGFNTGALHAGTTDNTGAFPNGAFHTSATHSSATHTGAFDTGQFDTGSFDTTGQWDAGAWTQAQDTGPYDAGVFASAYDTTGQWAVPGTHADTGAYDATAWNATPTAPTPPDAPAAQPAAPQLPHETAQFPQVELGDAVDEGTGATNGPDESAELPAVTVAASRAEARRAGNRRRRTPAKRSALLTVAVPSVCVMGVAGVAVASVGGLSGGKDEGSAVAAASDPASVKPVAANKNLDTQLANLSADASSFADRASRTQERIDLKARQDAEKKKKEEVAAAKEAARPKFVLPVTQKGLSAYYGQAGVNWMSVHTGIDFPVSFGTPVMSAIDGTVRTQWNSAYGNMAMVTGADGTETWYCHLSSTKIRSGPVKAGEVIAYSGSSGNSTGPHLHFEVRPHGGSSIDPLPWLRSHGLDPT